MGIPHGWGLLLEAEVALRLEDGSGRESQRAMPLVYPAPEWLRWLKALRGQGIGWEGQWVSSCLQIGPPSLPLQSSYWMETET